MTWQLFPGFLIANLRFSNLLILYRENRQWLRSHWRAIVGAAISCARLDSTERSHSRGSLARCSGARYFCEVYESESIYLRAVIAY
jgi:hypothetical protein